MILTTNLSMTLSQKSINCQDTCFLQYLLSFVSTRIQNWENKPRQIWSKDWSFLISMSSRKTSTILFPNRLSLSWSITVATAVKKYWWAICKLKTSSKNCFWSKNMWSKNARDCQLISPCLKIVWMKSIPWTHNSPSDHLIDC